MRDRCRRKDVTYACDHLGTHLPTPDLGRRGRPSRWRDRRRVHGIIGAFTGNWLLPQLGLFLSAGLVGAIVNATIGAILLLTIIRLVRGREALERRLAIGTIVGGSRW